jgi:uncharacterized damage-inducible protein DinB
MPPTLDTLRTLLWQQFGAALDMLKNAITACPDELWDEESKFCQIAHHTLFFLNYYLSDDTPNESDYSPPPPFTKSEFEDVPLLVKYDKEQLLMYLRLGRQKFHKQLSANTAEQLLTKRFVNQYKDFSLFELLLYNMRHVQHHAAQLNLLLRQQEIIPPGWMSRTKEGFFD